jgi:hypothetical protein
MPAIARSAGIALVVLSLGCVEVPESPADELMLDGLDGAVGAQLAIDGGSWVRPETAEPYTGPECDPTGSSMAGAAAAGQGAGLDGGAAFDPDAGFGPASGGAAGSANHPVAARRPSAGGELVISEVMSNPESVRDDAGEWFELHNPGAEQVFDLAGCAIDDGSASPRAIGGPLRIEPGAFVAIARSAEVDFTPDWTMSFSLGNAADVLALLCDGIVIDRVEYGTGFPLAPGASASLDPAALDAQANDAAAAWCLAPFAYGAERGSPGDVNPSCADADAGSE